MESVPYKNYPVLFVDDEEMAVATFLRLFRDEFTIYTAGNGEEALEKLAAHPDIALILTDERMPKVSGLELLARVAQDYPTIVNILVTAYSDPTFLARAVNEGRLYRYIEKPYEKAFLEETIRQGLDRYHRLNACNPKNEGA